ncbi:MAG: hypothetical protein WBE39_02490 [Candidatus Competibacter sp.]
MSGYTLDDVPIKTAFGAAQKTPDLANIPPNLYRLLTLVNGVRSVRDLLHLGIAGINIASFDELRQRKLIETAQGFSGARSLPPAAGFEQVSKAQIQPSAPPKSINKKGLAEMRFAVIDILLDLSSKDFGARPWIEKMERANSIAQLFLEVDAFCASPFGREHADTRNLLKRALAS